MRTMERRVRRLEEVLQRAAAPSVRLFWDDEVVACGEHARCIVEPGSGTHHAGAVRLSFGGRDE